MFQRLKAMSEENNSGHIINASSTKDDIHTDKWGHDGVHFHHKFTIRVKRILAKSYSECVTLVHPDHQDYRESFTVVYKKFCTIFIAWVRLNLCNPHQIVILSLFICRNLKFCSSF